MTEAVLQLKALGIGNLLRFNFPTCRLKICYQQLKTLCSRRHRWGIDQGKRSKPVSALLAEIPFGPVLSKMLYVSGKMGCFEKIVTATLQVGTVHSSSVLLKSFVLLLLETLKCKRKISYIIFQGSKFIVRCTIITRRVHFKICILVESPKKNWLQAYESFSRIGRTNE